MTDDNPQAGRDITGAIAGLWASTFGKGPDVARTYFNDDNVVVVMHGGLLPHEQKLIDAGDQEAVRALRHRFEQTIAADLIRVVQEATGRSVATFDSHMVFNPTRTFELFVLHAGVDPLG
jgi:uncharacterized protein YbcI